METGPWPNNKKETSAEVSFSFSVYTFRFIVILKSGMQSALSGLHTQTVFFMAFKNRFTKSEGSGE